MPMLHATDEEPGRHTARPAAHPGHDKHAGHDPDVFRRQFWIVLVLTLPVVARSAQVQDWLGYTAPTFTGSTYVPALFGAGRRAGSRRLHHAARRRRPGDELVDGDRGGQRRAPAAADAAVTRPDPARAGLT
jgi:hypothetical protein